MTLQSALDFSDELNGAAEEILPLRGGVARAAGDWADLDSEQHDRAQRRWAMMWEILAVVAITAIGAGLRFMWLDKPAIWGDEAATYQRVSGSFAELLGQLQNTGFVPLHYEFYWWWRTWLLSHGRLLSPVLMRLPVTICSTLMVPAVYLLARQLVGRSTALVGTLITATSAYMLFYAHDAKMYADSWLFCTLWMAAFTWWLRKGAVMAWLAWIATGALAAGISAPGLALLGVQIIWLVAQRQHRWWKTLLFLAGAAVIVAGPADYYMTFTKWGDKIQDQGWGASGLDWVNRYNAERTGPDLVRFTATTYLFAWEWPTIDNEDDIEPSVLKWCENLSEAVLALLILGTFPWPTRQRYRLLTASPPVIVSTDETHWTIVAGLRRMLRAGAPTAWWRSAMWIAVWIIVPTYGIYLASIADADSPMAWWQTVHGWLSDPWNAVLASTAAIAAFYCCAATIGGRFVRTLQVIGVLAVPIAVCFGVREILQVHPEGNVWMPRYLGFIWPAVAILATVLLLRLPSAPLRWGAVGLVIALNLVNGLERMIQYTEPPMAQLVGDFYAARTSNGEMVMVNDFIDGNFDPGRQRTNSLPAQYYLLLNEKAQPPKGYFWGRINELRDFPTDTDPDSVANLVRDDSQVRRLVIWRLHDFGDKSPPPNYGSALGPQWRRISSQQFHLFQYWNWNQLNWLDRDEFVRN